MEVFSTFFLEIGIVIAWAFQFLLEKRLKKSKLLKYVLVVLMFSLAMWSGYLNNKASNDSQKMLANNQEMGNRLSEMEKESSNFKSLLKVRDTYIKKVTDLEFEIYQLNSEKVKDSKKIAALESEASLYRDKLRQLDVELNELLISLFLLFPGDIDKRDFMVISTGSSENKINELESRMDSLLKKNTEYIVNIEFLKNKVDTKDKLHDECQNELLSCKQGIELGSSKDNQTKKQPPSNIAIH